MTTMAHRPFRYLLLAGVGLAVTGCAWLRPIEHFAANVFPHQPAIRPVETKLSAVAPTALPDRLYAEAVAALERRDYGQALEILQVANTAGHNDARILNALGVVYDKLGRFDVSGHYYDLAEKADPGSRVVAINRRYSQMLRLGLAAPSGAVTALRDHPATPIPQTARAGDRPTNQGGPS